MSADMIVLIIAWILTTIMLIMFVPKNKLREAQVIFFFKQLITWLVGLAVVQLGLIEYPVRLFDKASRTSFTFEYYIYPAICVVFNLHYPVGKSPVRKLLHYIYFCSAMTLIEVLCEKFTNIIVYVHWNWAVTWITLFITFFLSRMYYVWFFKLKTMETK